jgi:hypothetical protein
MMLRWSLSAMFGLVAVISLQACRSDGAPPGQSGFPTAPTAASFDARPHETEGTHAAVDSHIALPAAGRNLSQDVTFPPRNEPLLFRTALEVKYRDGLRRPSVQTFVDQEGTVVWTQEYLRYRVNLCSHAEAVLRVMRQIDGFGVQPVCGSTSTVSFPPRNEPFDFMLQLQAKYRDGLRRIAGSSFVDTEGNIVWTQEYLRYRITGCGHSEAQQRVFDQIDGRGVQPTCSNVPVQVSCNQVLYMGVTHTLQCSIPTQVLQPAGFDLFFPGRTDCLSVTCGATAAGRCVTSVRVGTAAAGRCQ